MSENKIYSAQSVFDGLKKTFHQYLEAQYHIWDESLISERRRLLECPGVSFQEPRLEATPSYTIGNSYQYLSIPQPARDILTLASKRPNVGIYPEPYLHQAEALKTFLGNNEDIIVATGTGSGKTESFLMPILGALAVESKQRQESWKTHGCRALLLYPMNALVNDQLSRLRRLLGDVVIAQALKGSRSGLPTFGRYTSRTPYPGTSSPARDRDRIGKLLEQLFQGLSPENKLLLEKEGKWPSKDIERFIKSSFKTGPEDSELLSRQEMQVACPDILITNYSMLEYMLLRPIERTIFEQTSEWLSRSKDNFFIVVLDEAHMYRGAGGAEVAYLLRRLHSRLGVGRDRIRYILTSASFGSGKEAEECVKRFAADLTGLDQLNRGFRLITGSIDKKPNERPATLTEANALAEYDFSTLHTIYADSAPAEDAIRRLFIKLEFNAPEWNLDKNKLRYGIYAFLRHFGPASLVTNLITAYPQELSTLAPKVFPNADNSQGALESLLALMSFAREEEKERVYAPVRSHLFFRGLPGLFACVNPQCSERIPTGKPSLLGRLYSTPRLRCKCGARVYELLTHRDCGAAFIRAYLKDKNESFLWHEPSNGLLSGGGLLESHFLVEVTRKSSHAYGKAEGTLTWLHIETGQLVSYEPKKSESCSFLPLLRPDKEVLDGSKLIYSFDGECPVCLGRWQGKSKIMDLMTKGEAPFAHLVRQSVALQPSTQKESSQSPNGGRKALLFSDGRQKAARLARDIPREIEQDVFRQMLIGAAKELNSVGHEALLDRRIYIAFLHILSKSSLQLFDGNDRFTLQEAVREYHDLGNSIENAIEDLDSKPPPKFYASLLRQLGSNFYSIQALTLGYLRPRNTALKKITDSYKNIDKNILLNLSTVWIQNFASRFAFDPTLSNGIRLQAAGHPFNEKLNAKSGFKNRQYEFLKDRLGELDAIISTFAESICAPNSDKALFLAPGKIKLEIAVDDTWYQCSACSTVSPVEWWGHCQNCLSEAITPVQLGMTPYLRARKGLWRDPVVEILKGLEIPLNLTVEEHTAQLSYRDVDEPDSTTEEYERRFRDILIQTDDTSIDVLSCTTTMEVGIDIGSLVAAGMRNVPPQRQNYQQRAGRAGRRGSAISTVYTYAQNSPHDNHYFENPEKIISSEPALPGVDTKNPKIIERHIRAQLVQSFFHSKGIVFGNSNIFSMLGETWEFYNDQGEFSLQSLNSWIRESTEVQECYQKIRGWLPIEFCRDPSSVGEEFLINLQKEQPKSAEDINQSDKNLIDFLFNKGFLPSYAFPRDICALQIEARKPDRKVKIVQRPQQALNIALSEYAPGRFVVVNKKTYRIGSVAANSQKSESDRAEKLFSERRVYLHCSECLFTAGFVLNNVDGRLCPLCHSGKLSAVTVIQPEVVYPHGGREIDEYDDEQVYTQATSAQLPIPEGEPSFDWEPFLTKGTIAFTRNQSLVMVNKGDEDNKSGGGFYVCSRCGKTSLGTEITGKHDRDYLIETMHGMPPPNSCNGEFQQVYLGYSFTSDVLLFRLPIIKPFRFDPCDQRSRQPLADGLQSLSEALVLAVSRILDIDIREISAGYRFINLMDMYYADLFVYDTLSGGAGYATMAAENFAKVFFEAELLLGQCDCSSSCNNCLRHYGNRLHHGSLDRFLALDLVKFIKTGEIPLSFDLEHQEKELKPLANMLQLAGYEISNDNVAPLKATRSGQSFMFWCYPSLVDPKALGFTESTTKYAFSPYELNKDLPGVFAEVGK